MVATPPNDPELWWYRQGAVMNDGLGYGKHVPTVRYGHLPLLNEQIYRA